MVTGDGFAVWLTFISFGHSRNPKPELLTAAAPSRTSERSCGYRSDRAALRIKCQTRTTGILSALLVEGGAARRVGQMAVYNYPWHERALMMRRGGTDAKLQLTRHRKKPTVWYRSIKRA